MGTAIALLADIAAGLAELHARGIPHNSITSSCCLLENEGWRGLLDLPLPPPFMHAAGLEPAQTLLYPIDYRWVLCMRCAWCCVPGTWIKLLACLCPLAVGSQWGLSHRSSQW
jgi:hypothetical protein